MISDTVLHRLLTAADDHAVENVRAGRGGPFAASLHVYDRKSQDIRTIVPPAGNAVLETGLASAHAEDQVLNPLAIDALKTTLKETGVENAAVLMISSAESCPACQAKMEILARVLIRDGLIAPGRFIVAYGASYADTKNIAGFNDEPYQIDFTTPPAARLIRQSIIHHADLPADVKSLMPHAPAVIRWRGGTAAGMDLRESSGRFTATAEVTAIHNACKIERSRGNPTPWDLGGGALYTFTAVPGPLAYAECQWANIRHWITVQHPDAARGATMELPGAGNETLYRAVAMRPYNTPDSALHVIRLVPFENKGQKAWRILLDEAPDSLRIYNGITTG